MDYAFTPYIGLGSIRFDMTRGDVETALATVPNHVRRQDKILGTTRLFFDNLRVFVDFDEADACCSIELPGDSTLTYQGGSWLPSTYGDLVARMHDLGLTFTELDDGLRCDTLGLSCWVPGKSENNGNPKNATVESIFLYRRGYHAWIKALLQTRGPWEPTDP